MKIAIPLAQGKLCMHFGHCEQFALIDVDENTKEIKTENYATPPPHEPGILPKWLSDMGTNCVIAGGMGGRAIGLFESYNIRVITGAPAEAPRLLVNDFLNNRLESGPNVCDH